MKLFYRAIGLAAGGLTSVAAANTPPFGMITIPTGERPIELRTGDFNGDGAADLAWTDYIDDVGQFVAVSLGRGDGSFEPRVAIEGAFAFGFLAGGGVLSGDFDGDGVSELLVETTNDGDGGAYALYGFVEGELALLDTVVLDRTSSTRLREASGDFNGDGIADVAQVLTGESSIAIWLGGADGFVRDDEISFPATDLVVTLRTSDFDGDGVDELVVGQDARAMVWRRESGSFVQAASVDFEGEFDDLLTGEFDGAPGADLVAFDGLQAAVASDVLGQKFPLPIPFMGQNNFPGPLAYAAVDSDGDGLLDVAASLRNDGSFGSASFSTLLRNTGGTFEIAQLPENPAPLGPFPTGVLSFDANGDGLPDLAAANDIFLAGAITVLLGQGDDAFGNASSYTSALEGFGLVGFSDLRSDGFPELILEESQQLFFIENEQGDFDFFGENAEPRDLIEPSVLPEGSREELADLDGDGDADVVLIDASGEIFRFAAAINNGGVFVEQLALTPSAPKGEYVFGGIVPAIDGSDEEDVLLRDVVETPADYNSADAVILESAGDGTFFERRIARPSPDARASGIRDVNGDGFPDLLWTIGFDTQLASLNDGSGGFLPAEPFEHFNLTVFDVDNDGRLDRVRLENAFSLDPVRLIVELQQPDGSFMESQVFGDFPEAEVPGFTLPFRLRHADLNSDGLQDLVISWRFLDRISVMSLTNLGNGEFGRHVGIVTRETLVFPFDFALGDVDADGDTDLAIGGFRGPGFLGPTGEFSGVLYNRSAGDKLSCEGDFNGDGRVGPADLGSLLALWGDEATELYPEADLNRDGVISASDLATLIAAWGLCD